MNDAQRWIDRLELRRHPEGGWFRETYRSEETITRTALPSRFAGDRVFSTAIYFLLEGEDFSAFHHIHQDEIWHFYCGSSVTVHVIDSEGNYSTLRVGHDLNAGHLPQGVVKAGCLFGATVNDRESYALCGCTVAPGFDFADFTMPSREELLSQFPQHAPIIKKLTR